jgi:hypothetical protein
MPLACHESGIVLSERSFVHQDASEDQNGMEGEIGQRLRIEERLARIPEAHKVAHVEGENLIRVGSPAVGPRKWL